MKDPIKRRVSMLLGGALAWAMVAGFGPASAQPAVPSYLKAEGRSFVLDNARLIDGSGAPARENVTLVIENGLVSYVGSSPPPAPAKAVRIDLAGTYDHTWIGDDARAHQLFFGPLCLGFASRKRSQIVAGGGSDDGPDGGKRGSASGPQPQGADRRGKAVGPRLFVTGPYLNAAEGGFLGDNPVATAEEARSITAFWAGRGATSVKVYSAISA